MLYRLVRVQSRQGRLWSVPHARKSFAQVCKCLSSRLASCDGVALFARILIFSCVKAYKYEEYLTKSLGTSADNISLSLSRLHFTSTLIHSHSIHISTMQIKHVVLRFLALASWALAAPVPGTSRPWTCQPSPLWLIHSQQV